MARRVKSMSMLWRRAAAVCSIALSLTLALAVTPAVAQQTDLNATLKRANELNISGNYPAALVEAQKLEAGVKAQFGSDHVNYAIALVTRANVYLAQGKYA